LQLTRLKSLREIILSHNSFSLLTPFADIKNLEILDVSFNKILEIEKLQPIKNLHKLRVLCIEGNMIQKRFVHYEKLIKDMLG
jgi:Leucine-rich repeat (LRR) protein